MVALLLEGGHEVDETRFCLAFFFGGGDSLEADGMICLLFFFGQFGRLLSNDACRGFHGNMWEVEKVQYIYIICIYTYTSVTS